MNIVIYANSSYSIGTGHIMRCLTLADYFKTKGANLTFMTDVSLAGNIADLITVKGYKIVEPFLERMPSSTDWFIIDNYDIDYVFEAAARKYAKSIMVIDDLANRRHDCDLLLDQNLYNNLEVRYNNLVPMHCILLLGPKYALLRDEFLQERANLKIKDGKVNRIFVNFGGIDNVDMTSKTLDMLKHYNIETDIIVGKSAMHLDKLKKTCSNVAHFNLHIQTPNIAQLIANSDLAIAAGGSSVWERCCLGLPSIIVSIADNQTELSTTLAENELGFYAGFYNENNIVRNLSKLLDYCLSNPIMLKELSEKIILLLNGSGKEYVWNYISRQGI